MAYQDYPRMMFHRTKPPVTIHSREEEDALGASWRRTVWPPAGAQAAGPAPELSAASTVPGKDAAPGDGDPPGAPHPETVNPERPQLTYNKLTYPLPQMKAETEPHPKRQRAPTVKPTGKPKKKSRDW